MLQRLLKLDVLSDEIAWELVTPLFKQRSTMVFGGVMYSSFGAVGYAATGSAVFLFGVVYSLTITLWRVRLSTLFLRRRETGSPTLWAMSGLKAGWATGVGWAAWSAIVATETNPSLIAILFGINAAFVAGAAVLSSSVPLIAQGQLLLGAVPLCIGCLLTGNPFFHFYAIVLVIQIGAGLSMIKTLHRSKLRTLSNEVQAFELSTKLAAANEELELVNQHLQQQVATDPLTGLLNRRAFDLAAAREWRAAARDDRPVAIVMIDVDHFKAYNDHYGHQSGDSCLRQVADVLSGLLHRPGDLLARYGGEEFIALLPSTTVDGAQTVSERVLQTLAERHLCHEQSPLGCVSVSMGISGIAAAHAASLKKLIERADYALYEAKRAGRNRVLARTDFPPSSEKEDIDDLDELFLFKEPSSAAGS